MSDTIARILFASASLVLTCTLAVASASASVPGQTTAPQATVRLSDLNLANAAGRETLDRRLRIAATSVCAEAGSPLQTMSCRNTALANARAQLPHRVASAS